MRQSAFEVPDANITESEHASGYPATHKLGGCGAAQFVRDVAQTDKGQ